MADASKKIAPIKMREDLKGASLPRLVSELFFIADGEIADAVEQAREKKIGLLDVLSEKKLLSGQQMAQVLAVQLGLRFIETIDVDSIPDDLLNAVPISFAKQNRLLPIAVDDSQKIIVACSNPFII
jgi:hypothetical protein